MSVTSTKDARSPITKSPRQQASQQKPRDAKSEFEKWLSYENLTEDLRQELVDIRGNEDEIDQRFGDTLNFGTGGMRGILGPGTNRMNIYTVRKATWALGKYLLSQDPSVKTKGVAVGYDCRHKSKEFAEQVGLTLARLGIRSFVSPYLCPTPEVSFTIRHLHAAAGIMITASHNPPEYNGYKVYGADGCQLLPKDTTEIRNIMDGHEDIFSIQTAALDDSLHNGVFQWTDKNIREVYVQQVVKELSSSSVSPIDRAALHIVYTPLHGTGRVPVLAALDSAGFSNVHVVEQQAAPDPDFSTVQSPNPGAKESLDMGVQLAGSVDGDIVMGTDPDCDRVGISVRDKSGRFHHLNGNQTGALLADFLLSHRKQENRLPANALVFKTIVTSDLGQAVAAAYGVSVENTLTGFKYIGHRATEDELTGEHTFIMGYEESYGYLLSDIVRDKDGVQACLTIAEMAACYKALGLTLVDRLQQLFQKFGTYTEETYSIPLQPGSGTDQREHIMNSLRAALPNVDGLELVQVEDYLSSKRMSVVDGKIDVDGDFSDSSRQNATVKGVNELGATADGFNKAQSSTLELPSANVLKYIFDDKSWIAVRPSGTEPKIKIYLSAHGDNEEANAKKIQHMKAAVEKHLKVK